jgi:predicted transcriptional regulator
MNYLFYDFYTKNEYFRDALGISRNTASKYLNLLVDKGFLIEEKVGKEKLYKNVYLYSLIDKW